MPNTIGVSPALRLGHSPCFPGQPLTLALGVWNVECGLETEGYAFVRIRTLRRKLRGVRWEIHFAPAAFGSAVDPMSSLQEAGSPGVVHLQLAQEAFDLGRQEGRIYRAEAGQQGRIRTAVEWSFVEEGAGGTRCRALELALLRRSPVQLSWLEDSGLGDRASCGRWARMAPTRVSASANCLAVSLRCTPLRNASASRCPSPAATLYQTKAST